MRFGIRQRTIIKAGLWNLGLLAPATQTTATERACLAKSAAGKRHLVEIGVFHGVTTLELRRAMHTSAVLWAVDPYPIGMLRFNLDERIARHTIRRSSNGTVVFVRTTGVEAARLYSARKLPPADFVFIDGDHSRAGIEGDWTSWSPLLATGGIIALHDSRSYPGRNVTLDSAKYTSEVILCDKRFRVIDEVESVTVLVAV
jgi:predicted O-methyltransferase YrrM